MSSLSISTLSELIKKLAPSQFNSIIIDNAVSLKRFDYCYLYAEVQRLEFRSDSITCAADRYLSQELMSLTERYDGGDYLRIDSGLVERMKSAPRVSGTGFFNGARRRMSELINGGREVNLNKLQLETDGPRLAKQQPIFAVKAESGVTHCKLCNGSGTIQHTDKQGSVQQENCAACEGFGYVGTLTWFTTNVIEKQVEMVRCLSGEIANLKASVIVAHKGNDTTPKRMLTRFNGINVEEYDPDVKPYLDAMHDKVGDGNAVEDIFFCIVPCFTFSYRNVITGEIRTGVVVDPFRQPELLLNLEGGGRKFFSGVSNSMKNLSHFFGGLGQTVTYKDKQDLRRTIRLLIAVAVADGDVTEEEKKTLTLTIRNISNFTTDEQDELVALLGAADSGFLTDDDFTFHSSENRDEALARLQEMATADGTVHDAERGIIERLNFKQ